MSTLHLWQDSFGDIEQLARSVFGAETSRPSGWTPASEVVRDGDDAVVAVEVPGVDPAQDVTVEIERGHLVIRGERRRPTEGAGRTTVGERHYGTFRRVFRLPDYVEAHHLSATYEAGILSVRVTGAYSPPKPVRVEVNSAVPVSVAASSASGPAQVSASGSKSVGDVGAASG